MQWSHGVVVQFCTVVFDHLVKYGNANQIVWVQPNRFSPVKFYLRFDLRFFPR